MAWGASALHGLDGATATAGAGSFSSNGQLSDSDDGWLVPDFNDIHSKCLTGSDTLTE